MRISSNNVGVLLAVLAGCTSLAETVWPGSAPQAESLNVWLPLAIVVGCGFLLAAFLADRHTGIARLVLLIGGVCLVASGAYFGMLSGGGGRSLLAVVADLGPGVLAIISGLLIGPIQRHVAP